MRILVLLLFFSQTLLGQSIDRYKLLHDKDVVKIIINSGDDSLKKEAIKLLLTYKRDNRLNYSWYGYTDSTKQLNAVAQVSTSYYVELYATNQFVALYLISAIYYGDLKFCEKVGLCDLNDSGRARYYTDVKGTYHKPPFWNKFETGRISYKVVGRKQMKLMYKDYQAWFESVLNQGLNEIGLPIVNRDVGNYSWDCASRETQLTKTKTLLRASGAVLSRS